MSTADTEAERAPSPPASLSSDRRRYGDTVFSALSVGSGVLIFLTLAAVAVFLTGIGIAPTMIAANSVVEGLAERNRLNEAFAWLGSAVASGVAIGSIISGVVIDELGTRGGQAVGVVAGGLAAALSTASGLLLVISSSVANDVYYKRINPQATEARQLMVGRIAMAFAILVAGYLGINPPGFVAQVVALAFGLGAASFFPALVLGIFWKRCTAMGAAAGMAAGLACTLAYQIWTLPIYGGSDGIFGISATSFGFIGMLINFAVTIVVSQFTPAPSEQMQQLVEDVRYPGRSELLVAHADGVIDDGDLELDSR